MLTQLRLIKRVTCTVSVWLVWGWVDIVQWVRKMTDGNKEGVVQILDPRLSTVPIHEVMHLFYVGMLCVEEQAVECPTMREAVQMLTELPKPPSCW
ncbi:putative non-specific serine/threonine protein kinase [Helianthus anomalus]